MSDDVPADSKVPAESPFVINSVYYQFGIKQNPAGGFSPVVSSWVYIGFFHRLGVNSKTCDVPGHFYVFQDFANDTPIGSWEPARLSLCTWRGQSMMTWSELLNCLDEQCEHDPRP
jgi:hypothetical protein